jgi:amino acid adenylation domain-containing protein
MAHVLAEEASFTQQGIWVSERMADGPACHLPLAVWLHGDLDVPALRRACAAVLDRHRVLTRAISDAGGEPILVDAATPPPVRVADLSRAAPGDVDRFVRQEIVRRFDLNTGPLCRFTLAALGPRAHLLLFVAHPLVFDGDSADVLLRDLAAYYGGAEPAPPPVSFAEAATAERERVRAGLADAREFWRTRWSEPADPVLPGQFRPARLAARGEALDVTLDRDALARLGIGTFEVLLAAVHVLLRRYGQTEVAVTVPVSTRDEATGEAVGPLVNELPVITRPDLGRTFRAFVAEIRAELRALDRFREIPLVRAVDGITPRAALTPVSMSYRRAGEPSFPGLDTRVDRLLWGGGVRNTLHLECLEDAAGLTISLRYNPAAIDRGSVSRFAGHLTTLLRNLDPDVELSDVDLMTADERRLLNGWNAAVESPQRTVLCLFAARVRETPDRVAVSCAGRELTYAELNAAANRWAHHLRRAGVGPATLVHVRLARSEVLLAGLLAVLKAGAAYTTEAGHVLDDAGDYPAEPDTDPVPAAHPDDLAYVSATGLEVTHAGLADLVLAMAERLGSTGDDRWLAHTALPSDCSVLELFLPLITGGRVVIAPEGAEGRPTVLARLIEDQGVTHVQATPAGWRRLLSAGVAGVTALVGGEALPPGLLAELLPRTRRLFSAYGPTGTTIWSTVAEPRGEITIGRPLASAQAHVLDPALHPVPVGVAGELYLGGASLGRGYRGQPRRTAERFVPNPFGPPGSRLYRTGDRVRVRPDGELDLLCRPEPPGSAGLSLAFRQRSDPPVRQRNPDAESFGFWRERLAGPPWLELPADRPWSEPSCARHCMRIPERTAAALERVAADRGATLFMVLLAAYQVLLSRHSGQNDVLVGTEWPDTVVLRGNLAGNPTFGELLDRTRRMVHDALEHPGVPFERLMTAFGLPRDARRNPLLPTMLTLHDPARDHLGDAAAEPFDPRFDLWVEAWREAGGLAVDLGYDAARFDAGTVAALAARFEVLLDGIAAGPEVPIGELPLLTVDDAAWLAAHTSGPEQPVPSTVPAMIAEAVAHHPDAIAVRCGPDQLSYAELDARVTRLAAALRADGLTTGEPVGVHIGRSVDAVVAALAVWRAGGMYLPLDPDHPNDYLAALVVDCDARAVLTPDDVAEMTEPPAELPAVRPEDAAYVIYTSGSTARPKGVVIEHRSLASRVAWMRAAYGLGPGDRVVQFASLGFDAHAEELYPALAAGAEVLLLPGGPDSLPDLLRTPAGRGVTVLDLPTAYWHRLVDTLDEITWPDSLRLVILGGAPVHAAAVARWRTRFADRVRLVNTYGPTEATIIATAVDLGPDHTTGRPPIGRPVAGVTALVLDERGHPVPPGVPGELCLSGAGLARGYLNRPVLTAEKFVPTNGSRRYRTGDRVRWRPDGTLEYLGRLDNPLTACGFRVEPAEIEAALLTHPRVGQAAVISRADTLVGYVVGPATPPELRAHLARLLPIHLIPTAWVSVESLPLTLSGKIDASALPAPEPPPPTELARPPRQAWPSRSSVPPSQPCQGVS